jgi:hypothetical protein
MAPEQSYAAARALHEARVREGWRALGRKIGFTNRTIWQRYGVHEPMWGTVYDRTLLFAKADTCSVPLAGLMQPRIEPEVCFKLNAAPRSSEPDEVLSSIEWMAHSVEIVQCHHPDWKVTIADCTDDNGLHGCLVVGTPVPDMGWNTVDVPYGSALFADVEGERFYFVHSYGVRSWELPASSSLRQPIVTWSEHGGDRFVAAVENGSLSATQFHPEKSGDAGLTLLRNWVKSL